MNPGVAVAPRDAESTRAQLMQAGTLHPTLRVLKLDGQVVFPLTTEEGATGQYEFLAGNRRQGTYADHLPSWRDIAPRAYDQMGDIILVRIPDRAWEYRHDIGTGLLQFHQARAVFHDGGVVGQFRTRDLHCIAGDGDSETRVVEYGTSLIVNPATAYYSPRLATQRARMLQHMAPGQRLIDMFGGVGPLAIQAAAKGLDVTCIDLNPAACQLARRNAELAGVAVEVVEADARALPDLPPADHVAMNLPHGAKEFLAEAAPLVAPGGFVHYHEILTDADLEERKALWLAAWLHNGRTARIVDTHHVRTYSPGMSHWAATIQLE